MMVQTGTAIGACAPSRGHERRKRHAIIEDQRSLEEFVERARTSSVLAVDTEFLRDRTYYAKLCFDTELATDDEVVLGPPLAGEGPSRACAAS